MHKFQQQTGRRIFTIGATTAVAASAILAATTLPAYAAAFNIVPTQVAAATGGTLVRISGTGLTLADAMGVRFVPSANACPANYNTAQTGGADAGLMDALGGSTSTTAATVVSPAGLAAGSTYKLCFYADAANGASAATDTTTDTVTAVNMAAQSTSVVKAGDKVTLAAPSAIFSGTGYASQVVNNTTTSCPLTLQTAAAGPPAYITAPTTAKVTGSNSRIEVTMPAAASLVAATPYVICTYASGTAGAALVARSRFTVATAPADPPTPTLNPSGGSSGIATTVTETLPTTSTVFSTAPDVLVTQLACPTLRPATANLGSDYFVASVTKIANYKIAVTVPTGAVVFPGDVTTPWNLCAYADNTTGAALVVQPSVYSVAPVLGVNSASFSPSAGPAQGTSTVTITSLTGIPTADGALLTASLGGSPITITGKTSTSITGTTSAHAAGPVKLSVTTAAGTKTSTTAPYTYTYGITVAPNTAPSGTTPVVDITGAGFGSLTFGNVTTGTALTANTAYVLLTDNIWNTQVFTPSTGIDVFATAPISYCNNVLPISDTEIICTLNLTAKIDSVTGTAGTQAPTITTVDVDPGTYTLTVANARTGLASDLYNYSIVSSGSTFTVSSY